MNILRIVYEWPPDWDGLTSGPFELTRAQAARGHTIRVLCGGWPTHATEAIPGVSVTRLPVALPRLSLFATTAPAALLAMTPLLRWADVIHGHGHLPACYHAWRARWGGHVPYVLHLHVTAAGRRLRSQGGSSADVWTRRFEWPLHERSDRRGCRVADAVVCSSEGVRQEAISLCAAPEAKTRVLSNGVNTSLFCPEGDDECQSLGWPLEAKVALFVGALTPRKRIDVLIEALASLDASWRLLIVGRGPQEAHLRERVTALGLEARVRFAGYRPYPEMPTLYRSADLLVLPSSYEGCPKVVLEALACGLSVVAGGFDLAAGPLREAITWAAADATPEALAAHMVRALGRRVDPDLRRTLDWSRRAEQLDALYERITGGPVVDTQSKGAR